MEGGRVAGLCLSRARYRGRWPRAGRARAARRVGGPQTCQTGRPGLRSCVQSPVHGSVGPRDDLERAGFGRSRSPTAAGRPVPRRVANTRSPERPDGKASGPDFRQARCNFLLAARIGDTAGVGVRPRSARRNGAFFTV